MYLLQSKYVLIIKEKIEKTTVEKPGRCHLIQQSRSPSLGARFTDIMYLLGYDALRNAHCLSSRCPSQECKTLFQSWENITQSQKDFLENIWPELFKTVKVVKDKKKLSNSLRLEERPLKAVWMLNNILEQEKRTSVKKLMSSKQSLKFCQ